MSEIESKFSRVRERIAQMEAAHRRPVGAVTLVAVSKRHSADKVVALARLGQRDMAENYAQEGVEKIREVARLLGGGDGDGANGDDGDGALRWHFIGHLQSRKCKLVAEHFAWVHTIDSVKVADKLNHGRAGRAPLNVLIQLNLQAETSKSGIGADELPRLAEAVAALPNLRLRGLMILPAAERAVERQRAVFRRCRALRDDLNARGFALDHLSMGMTDDMESAIAEGATMVRIGTALFGQRPA
ncbi:MAG: YggS family pyridoxal phosphate-dependent enzyme [bacterium]